MEFLDKTGVQTLWDKIKEKFMPSYIETNINEDGGDTYYKISDVTYGDFLRITNLVSSSEHQGVEMIFSRARQLRDGGTIPNAQQLCICGRGITIKACDYNTDTAATYTRSIDLSCGHSSDPSITFKTMNSYVQISSIRIRIYSPNGYDNNTTLLSWSDSNGNEINIGPQNIQSLVKEDTLANGTKVNSETLHDAVMRGDIFRISGLSGSYSFDNISTVEIVDMDIKHQRYSLYIAGNFYSPTNFYISYDNGATKTVIGHGTDSSYSHIVDDAFVLRDIPYCREQNVLCAIDTKPLILVN